MRDVSCIATVFAKGVDEVDSGFGIDCLRLSATLVQLMPPEQVGGTQRTLLCAALQTFASD
ncbi:hypothetical protein [Cypionkella sp.]|uniref:hypothetical protein n=1 Tax=Cypionkella sp. TaxID=2811411 RepID=UPI002619EC85|nr:hypothetical protein [Cypionkella sp.]MDB5666012.1 polymerase family protein [Cypionkella sp.]